MLSIISHQRNTNQNHKEIPSYTCYLKKNSYSQQKNTLLIVSTQISRCFCKHAKAKNKTNNKVKLSICPIYQSCLAKKICIINIAFHNFFFILSIIFFLFQQDLNQVKQRTQNILKQKTWLQTFNYIVLRLGDSRDKLKNLELHMDIFVPLCKNKCQVKLGRKSKIKLN